MLGAVIGRFRIQAPIGRGGFGDVWLATNLDPPHHRVAIKLFHPEIANSPAIAQCFAEARALTSVAATGIAKIYDAGSLPSGQAYMIRDYVDGETLMQRIAYGRHSLTQLADVSEQIANAIVAAAAIGVQHNNLKPSNVFIVKDADRSSGERIVVVDFAHGRLLAHAPGRGAAGYMAPEQDAGFAGDPKIDIYSLGCIAFELGCQRSVFIADTWDALRGKHRRDPAPELRSFVPDASAALDRLVARMLDKQPAERPKSMKDVAKLFQLMVGFEAPLGETVRE